jgi:hypothetical protein
VQEGIMEFLLEYNKQATIKEARIFIKEEYDIKASKTTVSICSAALTAFYTYDLRIAGRLFLLNVRCGEEIHPRALLLFILFLHSRYNLSASVWQDSFGL